MKIGNVIAPLLFVSPAFAVTGGTAVTSAEPIGRAVVVITEDHPAVDHHCTAILVREDVVLTAAHCADDLEPGQPGAEGFLVRTPLSTELCASSAVRDISYPPSMKHNDYTGLPGPDLALLRLKAPLCGVTPALISENTLADKDARFWSAGYGEGTPHRARWPDRLELSYPGLGAEGFLRKYYEPVRKKNFPEAKGETYYRWIQKLLGELASFEKFLVPVVPRTSLCKGDSGGPVYQEKNGRVLLFGVNSGVLPHPEAGLDRCDNGFTQLIQPVAPQLGWLRAKLAEWR